MGFLGVGSIRLSNMRFLPVFTLRLHPLTRQLCTGHSGISMQSVTVSMSACGSDHWGSSVTGLFCLSVSMSERTPRLTLVETRRVTESAGGACEQAF